MMKVFMIFKALLVGLQMALCHLCGVMFIFSPNLYVEILTLKERIHRAEPLGYD